MRNISPKEYAKLKGYKSVSTVYTQMRNGDLDWVWEDRRVKRIPYDESSVQLVKSK